MRGSRGAKITESVGTACSLATQSTTDFCKTTWGDGPEGAANDASDSVPSQQTTQNRNPLPGLTCESRHSICMVMLSSVEVLTVFMISTHQAKKRPGQNNRPKTCRHPTAMSTFITPLSSLPALAVSDPIGIGAGHAPGKSGGFQQAMAQATQHTTVQAQEGDTLIGLVKTHYKAGPQPLSDAQALRLAQQVATSNGIDNPDLILAGQNIHLRDLKSTSLGQAPRGSLDLNARVAQQIWQLNQPSPSASMAASALAARPAQWPSNGLGTEPHPVLDRTLSRA